MKLWPHQERGLTEIEAIRGAATDDNPPAICLAAPTGAGKSRMMIEIIERDIAAGKKVSLYTNRRLLLEQIAGVLTKHSIPFGIRAAGHERDQDKAVQLSSLQTEVQRVYKSGKWTLHRADTVLVDECHQQCADSGVKIISDHQRRGGHVIGFTATPLDIGHIYRHLVVAGTNSELRQCGAHVIAHTFGPDEPDTRHIKRQASGEFSEGDVTKVIMTPVIFGRVLAWWKKLNPDARPAILFGPGVGESLWFAEQFYAAGVTSAHIDGNKVWVNGEAQKSSAETREQVLNEFRKGEIKVLCNRFVLREGIDVPEIYHCIFATVFGGLQSYLQSGGRVLRRGPGQDHVCVARGTMILTDRGEIPVQDVLLTDKVWDGVEFVSHDGPACNGVMDVIQWDGLTATPNHKVLTNHGWETIAEAKASGRRIIVTGISGAPVRVPDYSNPHDSWDWARNGGRGRLLAMRHEIDGEVLQDHQTHTAWVQELYPPLRAALSRVDLSPLSTPVAAMQRHQGYDLSSLWRTRDSVPVPLGLGCGVLDCGPPWASREPQDAVGSYRQQRSLRARESPVGNAIPEHQEPGEMDQGEVQAESVCDGVSLCWIQPELHRQLVQRGTDSRGHSRTVAEVEVWDIVNAGPRNRYTANSRLVANCIQDHGGNWHRHGDLNEDREWKLEYTNHIVSGLREQRLREEKEPEPLVCPKCFGYRLWGDQCPYCGYRHTGRSRIVIQKDGKLHSMSGRIYRPRNIRLVSDTEKIWTRCVHRCRRSGMTFNQAEGLFFYENHYYPPRNLAGMPAENIDWFMPIKDVPNKRLLVQEQPTIPVPIDYETPW